MNPTDYTQKHKFVVDPSQQDNNNSQDLHVVYSIDEKSLIREINYFPVMIHQYCIRTSVTYSFNLNVSVTEL